MSDELLSKEPAQKRIIVDQPTTSKNDKRKNLQAGTFLRNKHPELFEILPRRGGFLQHRAIRRDVQHSTDVVNEASQSKTSPPSTSKSHIENYANIGEVLETNIRCPNVRGSESKDHQRNSMVRICSTAISTVMMLAQRTYENITMEHVRHTEEYFRGLKQPDGYPANVGQLLQLLTNLRDSGKIAPTVIDEENDENYDKEIKEEQYDGAEMSDLIS